MTNIPTLYRALKCEAAMRNHLQGILWFRSLKYFREKEGTGRDPMEGIGSYVVDGITHQDVGDENPIFPAFILSFSERPLVDNFGSFVLKLTRPDELRNRIVCRFPERSRIEWHRVEYDKKEELESDPSPVEGWNRKHFAKPECFADEREWRLVVFLPSPLSILNDTLKVNVGNLQGVFQLMASERPC